MGQGENAVAAVGRCDVEYPKRRSIDAPKSQLTDCPTWAKRAITDRARGTERRQVSDVDGAMVTGLGLPQGLAPKNFDLGGVRLGVSVSVLGLVARVPSRDPETPILGPSVGRASCVVPVPVAVTACVKCASPDPAIAGPVVDLDVCAGEYATQWNGSADLVWHHALQSQGASRKCCK